MGTGDSDLLTAYANNRDAEAFRQLVLRHIEFVYAAAVRQSRDRETANDITQAVFVLLSQRASTLTHLPSLKGWLFNTTRYVAANARRAQSRRTLHESEAAAMRSEILRNPAVPDIAPHLDDALASLPQRDREVLLLRYFDDLPLDQLSGTLGISQHATKKRLARAIDRIRDMLTRRGVSVTSASLPALIAPLASLAVPSHLAGVTFELVLSGTAKAAGTASALSLAKGAAKMMSQNKLKWIALKAAIGTAFAATAAAAVVAQHPAASSPPPAGAPVIQAAVTPENTDDKQMIFDACTGVFQSMIDAADQNDVTALLALYYFDPKMNSTKARVARVNIEAQLASYHLQKSALTHFGGQALGLNLHCQNTMGMITDVLSRVGPENITMSGDTAILTPPEIAPGGGNWPSAPIYFKQINGDWKLDYDRTFSIEFRATRRQPIAGLSELQDLADTAKSIDDAWNALADDIDHGKVTSAAEAQKRVNATFAKVFPTFSDLSMNLHPR